MTSNVGSRWIAELGPGQEERVKERALESLRQQISPEFLNRVDEFVVFRSRGREQLRCIVEIQLRRAAAALERQRIRLEATPEAMDLLAEKGFDPQYGARPLRRTIQREVMNLQPWPSSTAASSRETRCRWMRGRGMGLFSAGSERSRRATER